MKHHTGFRHQTGIVAIALIVLAMVVGGASAAPEKGQGGKASRGVGIFVSALEKVEALSDEQKVKTSAIIEEARAQLVALRDEAKSQGDQADRKLNRAKAQEILLSAKAQIEAELTEPQVTAFREAVEAIRAAAPPREKGKSGKGKKGKGNDANI